MSHVDVEFYPTFTDHGVVTCGTSLNTGDKVINREKSYLCETGHCFGSLDFNKAPWLEVRQELAALEWSGFKEAAYENPTKALNQYNDQVLIVLEKLVPAKKDWQGKPKMSKQRKYLWCRLAKVRERLMHSTSACTITRLLKERRELEIRLKQLYCQENAKEEKEAIPKIKQNSNVFFSLAKRRQKTRANIGPFLDPKTGKLNPDPAFSARVLKEQYDSVFVKT